MKHLTPGLAWWYTRKSGGLEHALWQRSKYSLLKDEYIKKYHLKSKLKTFTNGYRRYYSIKAHHRRELFDIGVEQRLIDSELSARMFRMEFRYPMLDVPLVEFAYNLPSSLKIHDGIERYAFRQIIKGVVTERTRKRLKSDVSHPNRDLFALSEDEKQDLQELLRSPFLQKYCNRAEFNVQNKEARFVLKHFDFFAPVFRYFSENNIPVS